MKYSYPVLLLWWLSQPQFPKQTCRAFQIDTQQRQLHNKPRRAVKPVYAHYNDAPSEVSYIRQSNPIKRKRKKNKYQEFSKVQDNLLDPLESLIAESEKKQQILTEESRASKAPPSVEIAPLPKIEFPDNKEIDPYDPTSFGYIEIGCIVGAHGVHGWVKVRCTTDFPMERLCTAGIRHLKMPNKRAPRKIVLLQGKHRHNDEYLVQLENIESRESAQNLRGAWLYVRQEQDETSTSRSQAKEEYMISDLVGLEVFLIHEEDDSNEMGKHQFVGRVGGVVLAEDICSIPGLGHDYLEVVLPRGIGGTFSLRDELVLIPFVPPIVPRVDLEQRACWIDPPNGLLDLTYVREEKTRIRGFLPTASERM